MPLSIYQIYRSSPCPTQNSMGNTSGTIESMVDSATTAANSLIAKVGQASGFSATKVWHLKLAGEGYVITLRHELSGERNTYVNGKLIHKVIGSSRDLNINFKGNNRVTVRSRHGSACVAPLTRAAVAAFGPVQRARLILFVCAHSERQARSRVQPADGAGVRFVPALRRPLPQSLP